MTLSTKLAVVLRDDLEPNLAANAAAVLGLSLGGRLPELLGEDGKDASGFVHASPNTHPVPVLIASAEQLRELGSRAPLLRLLSLRRDQKRKPLRSWISMYSMTTRSRVVGEALGKRDRPKAC